MKNIISFLILAFCAGSVFAQSGKTSTPAIQVIPAGTVLKTSAASQAPVTTAAAVKPVEVNNNAAVAPALVAMPVVNIATGADAAQQVKTTPVVATQQVQGQPKPAEVVVTPPSIINEPKKAPVKE